MVRTSFLDEKHLPLVVEPDEQNASVSSPEALSELCSTHKDFLQRQLLKCGAMLLRGFGLRDARDFNRFVRLFSGKAPLDYVGGVSPRTKLGNGTYTSTEYPSRLTLPQHNEMSYSYRWPAHLFFCCMTAAERGGETSLADSRTILRSIDAEVVARFKTKKILYVRNLSGVAGSAYSWQSTFETGDKSAVEAICREGGMRFTWKEDGGLRLDEVRPATATHPQTGDEVWFNQAEGFHPSAIEPETYRSLISRTSEAEFWLNSFYGDGAPLELPALEHVREVIRGETALVPWREGDVLVVDNLLACHGRMPFTGPRKILVSMT